MLAGCVTVVLGMTGATLARGEAPSTLSEQIQKIAQRMVVEVYAALRDAQFCQAFFNDFQVQRHITHIQPVLEAEKYRDPVLKPILERCPNLQLNKEETFEGPPQPTIYYTDNVRLYKVDLNNRPADGPETVIFMEHWVHKPVWENGELLPGDEVHQGGQYVVLDFDSCQIPSVLPVGNRGGYALGDPHMPPAYSGIIRYRGQHYVFDLHRGAGNYRLDLWGYPLEEERKRIVEGSPDRLVFMCGYSPRVPKKVAGNP